MPPPPPVPSLNDLPALAEAAKLAAETKVVKAAAATAPDNKEEHVLQHDRC